MTVLTVATIVTVTTAGAAAPLASVATSATAGSTIGLPAASAIISGTSATVAVSGATAAGTVAGSIAGAVSGVGATTGALVGGGTAGAITSTTAGVTGLVSGAGTVLAGPVGWILLGSAQQSELTYTFDCWKPILHDYSLEPSKGILIKDIAQDPRIKDVSIGTLNDGIVDDFPEIILTNIWDERFKLDYLFVSTLDQTAAHATKLF